MLRVIMAALVLAGGCGLQPRRAHRELTAVQLAKVPEDAPRRASRHAADPVLASAPRRAPSPGRPAAALDDESPEPPEQAATREATVVKEVFFGDGDRPLVALTFDDGPNPATTRKLLHVLHEYGVPATFFVLGDRASKWPKLLADIRNDGHELGNHSWSHGSLRAMVPAQIRDELDDTNAAIARVTGATPGLFRPPFGRYAPSSLPIVAERGMNYVLWSVDGLDWGSEADEIAHRVVADTHSGDIVLLHDATPKTAEALPAIIRGLRAKGLGFATVSDLTGLPAVASLD
mgnify:CR=1 FL=1